MKISRLLDGPTKTMKTLFLLLILSVAVAAQTPTSFTGQHERG